MTELQENALRYETRKRGKELKAHIATLKAQMNRFDAAWQELGETFRNHLNVDKYTFRVVGGEIHVLCPAPVERPLHGQSPTINRIATASLSYFDPEALTEMLSDLERTKQEYAAVKKQCDEMGDPL